MSPTATGLSRRPYASAAVAHFDFNHARLYFPARLLCEPRRSLGYQSLVEGVIEGTDLTALEEPLAYFQGRYRAVEPPFPAERRSDASGGEVPAG